MDDIRWDDLKYLLAVGRKGTIRAAASELRVNHATISRHLRELQQRLGVEAFERDGRRIKLTEEGSELLRLAQEIEVQVLDVTRKVAGQSTLLQGHVRVALTDSLLEFVAPSLPNFHQRFPGVSLEFVTGLRHKSLSRNEADVAIRATDEPEETLVGRRISTFALKPYGARALLDTLEPCAFDEYPWVGWSGLVGDRWRREGVFPHERVRLFVHTESAMLALIRAGIAVGYMPALLGESDPALRPLKCEAPGFSLSLWVLTHADLQHTPRILAVTRWFSEVLGEKGS